MSLTIRHLYAGLGVVLGVIAAIAISSRAAPLPLGTAVDPLYTALVSGSEIIVVPSGDPQPVEPAAGSDPFPVEQSGAWTVTAIPSGTQAVSGTVTANQGGAPWTTTATIAGTAAVTQSGAWSVGQSGAPWSTTVSGTAAVTQSGAWAVSVNDLPAATTTDPFHVASDGAPTAVRERGWLTASGETTAGGSSNLTNAASVTAYIAPGSSEVYLVDALAFSLLDDAAFAPNTFGGATALATGLTLRHTASDGTTVITTYASALSTNLFLAELADEFRQLDLSSATRFSAVYVLRFDPPIVLDNQERLQVVTNDATNGLIRLAVEASWYSR